MITIQEQILEYFNLQKTKLDKIYWIQEISDVVKQMEKEMEEDGN